MAPVTLDNADYCWLRSTPIPGIASACGRSTCRKWKPVASFEKASLALAGREFPQVLLIHANELNADLMPEPLAMFRCRGYTFVTFEEALADPVCRLPDDYVGRSGVHGVELRVHPVGQRSKVRFDIGHLAAQVRDVRLEPGDASFHGLLRGNGFRGQFCALDSSSSPEH